MRLRHSLKPILLFAGLAAALAVAGPATATEIWSGRTYTFTKAPGADWTLPANQDRITPLVWITRANTAGIFNIHSETGSGGPIGQSPLDTEWATGEAVNHASLTFDTWANWAQQNPPGTVGVNAVVHLITEDIYIDIRFDAWGVGASGGGSFRYTRGEPGATPADAGTWGRLKAMYR